MSLYKWLNNRECGNAPRRGDGNLIMRRAYGSMELFDEWHQMQMDWEPEDSIGAIFNLEFNGDGNILVGACEKKAVVLYDVITRQLMHKITGAHGDNVNCIKFLDDRLFATGSDDETVALWDLRYLKQKVRALHGHSNWVKNVEYSPKDKLLVTSGFDGSIFTWDINSQTEQGLISQKVFQTSGLMRCRISPDGEKLVLSTSGGFLMIIHHLDLTTLHKDLCGFKPSMYRLMQMGEQYIPQAAKFDYVFSKKQKLNRVEFVTDFPDNDDAEMIGALQIHPHGYCVLSRNTCCSEQSEWTCIHDINEEQADAAEDEDLLEPAAKRTRRPPTTTSSNTSANNEDQQQQQNNNLDVSLLNGNNTTRRPSRMLSRSLMLRESGSNHANRIVPNIQQPNNRQESFVPDIWAAEVTVHERAIRQSRARSSSAVTGYNFVYALSSGVLPVRAQQQQQQQQQNNNNNNNNNNTNSISINTSPRRGDGGGENRTDMLNISTDSDHSSQSSDSSSSSSSSSSTLSGAGPNDNIRLPPFQRLLLRPLLPSVRNNMLPRSPPILQNAKKLMFYKEEPNEDRGFIKEPCFSADGRIVCSPFGRGFRLLSYKEDCSEYPRFQSFDDVKRNPRELFEISKIVDHENVVYCTKFSPREPLLVTGCQGGFVKWYHPEI